MKNSDILSFFLTSGLTLEVLSIIQYYSKIDSCWSGVVVAEFLVFVQRFTKESFEFDVEELVKYSTGLKYSA